MKRVLSLVFVLVVAAASAQAASISALHEYLGSNPLDPRPGDTFVLHVFATANSGEIGTEVFGRLGFEGAGSITSGVVPWLVGPVACGGSACDVFNQVVGPSPFPVTNTPLEIATVMFVIGSVGAERPLGVGPG